MKNIKRIQLRLIYSLLFYSGIRINETRLITYEQFQHLIQTGEINIIHQKTRTCKIHLIPNEGRKHFQQMAEEINFLFKTNQFLYLGSTSRNKEKTYTEENYLRTVNLDLNSICKEHNIFHNFKSHSFRTGFITKLLKTTSVQETAQIIGHSSIDSTMSYYRYTINSEAIQEIFKTAFNY